MGDLWAALKLEKKFAKVWQMESRWDFVLEEEMDRELVRKWEVEWVLWLE